MASRRDDDAQLVLLAGVLIILAFLLYATQSAVLSNVGQQAGREAQDPVYNDYALVRVTLATTLHKELTDAAGVVVCPDDIVAYGGRVQGMLSLLQGLEDNRGQLFSGHFLSAAVTGAANPKTLTTTITLFFASSQTSINEQVAYSHSCTDL